MALVKTKRIINKDGLCLRPSAEVVKVAAKFQSKITMRHGDSTTDAKSIMGLMTLGAAYYADVEITADGADEKEAMRAMEKVIDNRFGQKE